MCVQADVRQNGLAILHSDYAPSLIVAREFRNGQPSVFTFGMSYSGNTLTAVRGAWEALLVNVFASEPEQAQMAFTYGVVPVLLVCAFYFLFRAYLVWPAAVFAGLFLAFGFQMLGDHFGNDAYVLYLVFSAILLGVRSRFAVPFLEMNPRQLVALGIAFGVAIYTSRISALFIVAFFADFRLLRTVALEMWRAPGKLNTVMRWTVGFFVGLYIYLQIFGANLGYIGEKAVKVHAGPNLRFAFAAAAIIAWPSLQKRLSWAVGKRGGLILAGFLVGFFPELFRWATQGRAGSGTPGMGLANWHDVFLLVAQLPETFRILVTAGEGLERQFPLMLVIGGLVILIIRRKEPLFQPVIWQAFLALAAFVLLRTYVTGDPRYFFPIYPVFCLGVGLVMQAVWELRRPAARAVWSGVLVLALAAHGWHQAQARERLVQKVKTEEVLSRRYATIERFRKERIDLVITNNYWYSNQYTYIARFRPIFIDQLPGHLTYPPGGDLVRKVDRAGYLAGPDITVGKTVILWDRTWETRELEQIGDRRLFLLKAIR